MLSRMVGNEASLQCRYSHQRRKSLSEFCRVIHIFCFSSSLLPVVADHLMKISLSLNRNLSYFEPAAEKSNPRPSHSIAFHLSVRWLHFGLFSIAARNCHIHLSRFIDQMLNMI